MESDKSEEDEHEPISKQIVEYYKKYSLSQQLPKYFSGTSLSYMPNIVKDEEINKPVIIVEDTSSATLIAKQSEYCQTDIEEGAEPKAVSPASSVASVRKLEWDSGADIGYNNCNKSVKLHKSFSLPTLTSTSDHKHKDKSAISKLSSHIVTVVSYSSSDHVPEKTAQSSSSSSYQAEAPVMFSSSSSSAKPPSAKPLSSSSSSSAKPPSAKSLSSSSNSNTFAKTLAYLKTKIGSPDAESTPKGILNYKSTIDSSETPFIPRPYKKIRNKVIELCVTKPISIECIDSKRKTALDKRVQTSFVEKLSKSVQTGDDTVDEIDAKKKNSKENQSVIIINYECPSDKKTCSSNTQTDSVIVPSPEGDNHNNLRRTGAHSDLAASTDFSKEIPLLEISKKHSKSLVVDIDRSIALLQKLLLSKKYDSATKKRYVKKIVDKIIDNKYNEDSTTSSELFMPKKQDDKIQQKLQDNVPWYPPKISKFGVKTFKDEFLPEKSKKKSLFTVSEAQYTSTSCLDSYSSLEKQQNTTSGSCQSWKEDKTLSERLLEEKQKGEGDHLVNFAVKERQNQIEWINDEISHLIKLKDLLEQNQIHTTTTVYMVSQQNDNQDSRSSSGRNYVIQTELSGSSSSDEKQSFQMNGQTNRKNNCLKGEFEICSDEQTTNIKVKGKKIENGAIRKDGLRRPTLIGTGKYDTYPRSKQEEQRCWPCGIMKTRRDNMEGLKSTDRYSFDIRLSEDATAIMKKVDEIVNKYGSKSSVGSSKTHSVDHGKPCLCACKCQTKNDGDVLPPKKACGKDVQCTIGCNCKQLKHSDIQCICSLCVCKCQTRNDGDVLPPKKACDKDLQCTIGCNCKQLKDTDIQCICSLCACKCQTKNDGDVLPPKKECDKDVQCTIGCDCKQFKDADIQCICTEDAKSQTEAEEKPPDAESRVSDIETMNSVESTSNTSRSNGSSSSASGSIHSCVCCKKKNVNAKVLCELRKKLSEDAYPLCRPCYRQNRRCAYTYNTYTTPGHVCNCYTMVKTKTLDAIKQTINDLEDLEYCSCVAVDNESNSSCCQYCRKKLKKTSKNRNGIAYLLTFENGTPCIEKERRTPLEEIRIKIPAVRKKRHKDKENKKRKNGRTSDREEGRTSTDYTLQEYLNKNRPDFVETAEERRKTVDDTRNRREEVADQNRLKFLQNYQNNKEKNSKRIFSEKEMKEITRRNYRKLPEVQQRLVDNKRKQIRLANRLIADIFNKKLREKVLKGKRTLPTDVNVVNL